MPLAATMTLVFAPKLAGVAQVLLVPRLRRCYGGGLRVAASTLVELVFSFILAPIMAVGQSIFLLGMLAGRTIRWEAQLRDLRSLGGARRCGAFGRRPCLAWSWGLQSGLWPLIGPNLGDAVPGPLLLAVPFAVVTSWTVPRGAGHATGSAPCPRRSRRHRSWWRQVMRLARHRPTRSVAVVQVLWRCRQRRRSTNRDHPTGGAGHREPGDRRSG